MADGKGCKCGAYGACECGCPDVDWTPQEVYDLRKRLSHLMDVAGKMAGAIAKELDWVKTVANDSQCKYTRLGAKGSAIELESAIAEWDGIKKEGV